MEIQEKNINFLRENNIYLKKIKHLISNKIVLFNHVIVGIDLTDLEDDWQRREIQKKRNTSYTNSREQFKFKLFLAKNLPTIKLIIYSRSKIFSVIIII